METSLAALPKIELHDHLDGGLRPSTILALARSDGVRLPTTDERELARLLSPGPSSLEIYLQAFAVTVSVLQTAHALRRAATEAVEDWHRDGVVDGEIRFAPELHTDKGLSMETVVEAVLLGLEDGRRTTGVDSGLILCSMRHAKPTVATARLVRRYREDGVVGFDIAGAESGNRATAHRDAFEYCAEHLLAATCHAGEVTDPSYIRDALVACRALRIGHGTQLIQEWGPERLLPPEGSLTRWILDRQIPLEICLSSNLQTKASPSAAEHPFELFRRTGLAVTLNTDNRLVSATTLTGELDLARTTWSLSGDELLALQRTALDAAFCAAEIKTRIRAKYFSEDADSMRV